jgi:FAD/FMN-containing dehydrogenase
MLSFAQAHGIKPWIELMPMSKVNEAIERVKQNKARYRIVLFNDPASASVCTLGGNVATNAGGMRGAKYGASSAMTRIAA